MTLDYYGKIDLKPPCSFQGGKVRISRDICEYILPYITKNSCNMVYDLCCGSGAISLELLRNGVPPSNITMIDISSFGGFWEMVSNNTFSLDKFSEYLDRLPKDVSKIQEYLKMLSDKPVEESNEVYIYLLLQAGSFGSKQIGVSKGKYTNCSFRRYWIPTENSNRRSPVNPMMPMPDELYKRVYNIVNTIGGIIKASRVDLTCYMDFMPNSVCYIDPPYNNTTGYMYRLDYGKLIDFLVNDRDCVVVLSETDSIDSFLKSHCSFNSVVSSGRKKGGISGDRKIKPYSECVYIFCKDEW